MRKVLVLLFSVLLNSAHAFDIDVDEMVDGFLSECEDLNKAWNLYDKQQYSRAIILFNCNGTPEANGALGYMYEHGKGVDVDYKKASEFYHLAAGAGRSDAQNNLGALYENGHLGKPDYDKAFKYYSKSSEQGHALAKSNLGRLYANGKGTPRDVKRAISLWKVASAKGNHPSTYLLAQVYSTNDFGVKNLNSAKKWATFAIKKGMPEAKDLLAKVNAELHIQDMKKKESSAKLHIQDMKKNISAGRISPGQRRCVSDTYSFDAYKSSGYYSLNNECFKMIKKESGKWKMETDRGEYITASEGYVLKASWVPEKCKASSPVDGFKDFKFGMTWEEEKKIKQRVISLLGEERDIHTKFKKNCLDKIWIEFHGITQKQNLELRKLLPKKYGLSFAPSKIDFDKYNAIKRNSDRSNSDGDRWITREGREYDNRDNNLIWGYADGQVLFMLRKEWVSDLRCVSYLEGCKSRVSGYIFYLDNQRAKEVLNEGLKRTRIRNKKTTINDL